MKVTRDKTEDSQAYLTIEMEPEEVEKSLDESYRRLVKTARIPGFRKGKAPRDIFERYIGRESLLEDTLNSLVPRAYEDAIKEQDLEAIAQPQIEVTKVEPVVFTAVVPLKPTVKLGDYHSIRMEPEKVEVNGSNVEEVLENLRHQYATWEPVERAVDFGDMIAFDVESSVGDKPYINQKGAQYQVIKDQAFPAPGFAEQLVGMSSGEEKEFTIQLSEDAVEEDIAGKEAFFKIKLNEIKQEILPELNDDFAAQVDPEFKTLDELRERALSDLTQRAEERVKQEFEEKLLDALVEISELEFPPVLVDAEIHRMMDQRFQGQQQQLEQYLQSINKTEEEVHEELHPLASTRVSRSLALGKIIEEEKIEVDSSEIDAEIQTIAENAGENKDSLLRIFETPQARETIEQRLVSRKAMQLLTDIAKDSKSQNKTETIVEKEETNE